MALQQYLSTAMPVAGHRPPATGPAEAVPERTRTLHLKCLTSGLMVFSLYAAANCLQLWVLWVKYSPWHKNEFLSRSLSKQKFSSDKLQQVRDHGFPIMFMLIIGKNESSTQNLMRMLNFANQVNQVKVRLQFLVVEFCSWRYWSTDFSKSPVSWNQLNQKIRREYSILQIRQDLLESFFDALDIYNGQWRRHPR